VDVVKRFDRLVVRLAILLLFATAAPLQGRQLDANPAQQVECVLRILPAPATVSDAYSDLLRVAELAGVLSLQPRLSRRISGERDRTFCATEQRTTPWDASRAGTVAGTGPALAIRPMTLRSDFNSAYPRDINNGARWAGRGVSAELSGGLELRWGALSAAAAPAILVHQNRAFETVPVAHPERTAFAHPWHRGVDLPQRFGETGYGSFDPGQSYVRIDAGPLAAGVSTENLWWGPALRYPLLMSNTAAGFPHAFIGTSGARNVGIGRAELQAVWGRLTESPHFDDDADNDHRLIAGLTVGFEPRGLPGLFLGAGRIFVQTLVPGELGFSDYVLGPYRSVRENPLGADNRLGDNQLISAFARWAHPAAGLEVYLEWAREDHWEDLDELIAVPDASQAVTLGLQKVMVRETSWIRLAFETTRLDDALPFQNGFRGGPLSFYVHSQVIQGHTQRGQLLGAYVGTGADAQYLALDRFSGTGRAGVYLERIRREADTYRMRWSRAYGPDGHDVEVTAGVHQLRFVGAFDLAWGASYSHRSNRDFLGMLESPARRRTEGNWGLRLDLGWHPGR
jgi:hypothetical protein